MKLPVLCSRCLVQWTESEHTSGSDGFHNESLLPNICEKCIKQRADTNEETEITSAISINKQNQLNAQYSDTDTPTVGKDTSSDNVLPLPNDSNCDTEDRSQVNISASVPCQPNTAHNNTENKHKADNSERQLDGKRSSLEFGEAIRQEFLLHEGSTFLNNGSYGAVPRRVHEYRSRLQLQMELHPQKWFVHDFPSLHKQSIARVASFLGTEPEDTFLVQNVTKGCNTVIKAFPLRSGDAILVNNLTYSAIFNTALHTADVKGAKIVSVDITFPVASEDALVEKFEKSLQENINIKLAIFDHITSSTALLMPVKRLTEVCHRHDVVVLIDGAHVPGQLNVDLTELDADFYTGNFHKWAFTPRSCAVLWKNPQRNHAWFRPLVTSCEHGTSLQEEFSYEGTKDDTAYYSVTEGIAFIESIGGLEKIYNYNVDLKKEAYNYLSSIWGTSSIDVPESMVAPFMKLLQLPELKDFHPTPADADRLQTFILDKHNVDCKIHCRDQKLFCRLSVQIYNLMDDFRKLGTVIRGLRA